MCRSLSTVIVLATLATFSQAQSSPCRTSTTLSVPPATRILRAASTCALPGGQLTPTGPYTTIYQTTYLEFCPTGLQPKTYTVTESCSDGQSTTRPTNYIPPGFTTTVTECHVCGKEPITATLTVPCGKCSHAGYTNPTTAPGSAAPNSGGSGAVSVSNGGKPSPNGVDNNASNGGKGAPNGQSGAGSVSDGGKPSPNGVDNNASNGGKGAPNGQSGPVDQTAQRPGGNNPGGQPPDNNGPKNSLPASQTAPACASGRCQGTSTSTSGTTKYTGAAAGRQPEGWLATLLAILALLFSMVLS